MATVEADKQVDPGELVEYHGTRDQEKLNSLIEAMRENGWQGRPILAQGYMAWTGSHRIAAAREVARDDYRFRVPVIEIPADIDVDVDCGDDLAKVAALEDALGTDHPATRLMQAEVDSNLS